MVTVERTEGINHAFISGKEDITASGGKMTGVSVYFFSQYYQICMIVSIKRKNQLSEM